MSVTCDKCGADISFESEEHPNCQTVQELRKRLSKSLESEEIRYLIKRLNRMVELLHDEDGRHMVTAKLLADISALKTFLSEQD